MSTRTASVRRWLAIGTLLVGALALAGCHGAHYRAGPHYSKGHHVVKPHPGGKYAGRHGGHHRRGHHGPRRRHW